ncbi:MAG: DUF4402 domain-containing protein [Candidatus Wallbacteria bacterium]|nr:DUF4402 domain-containing protein [Candidatus Wallbacteria bacterium]
MRLSLFLFLMTCMISNALAGDISFDISVKIKGSIGVIRESDLIFKDIMAKSMVQTITVQPKVGDLWGIPAKFTITGTTGLQVDCSITGSATELISGSSSMPVGSFRIGDGTGAGDLTYSTFLVTGFAEVFVGATLTVAAWQTNGNYSAQQTFTVIYH